MSDYSKLITAEHKERPHFMAIVELLTRPSNDLQAQLLTLPTLLDLDIAAGQQLDEVGLWVGFGRYQFVPSLGSVTLADQDYRVLLRAKVLGNHWDGQMSTLQTILASIFPGTGITLYAVDNQDMSMDIYLTATGGGVSATQLALLQGGLLVPKPEAVRINNIIILSGITFGLDFDNASISGPDVGSFATYA